MSDIIKTITAAILVIGDEILSGRTKDKNIGYIAEYLTASGIDVWEVRVVPDIEDEIVTAVNALRARYDYVFSTGGIGRVVALIRWSASSATVIFPSLADGAARSS